MQRERRHLSPVHLDLRLYQRVPVPDGTPDHLLYPDEGQELNLESIIWRMWHYLGGSHTWRLTHDPDYAERVQATPQSAEPPPVPSGVSLGAEADPDAREVPLAERHSDHALSAPTSRPEASRGPPATFP